jgi:hypothetical protein
MLGASTTTPCELRSERRPAASSRRGDLAEHTGQTIDRIHADTERDFILGPEQARDCGVVDEVVASRVLVGVPRPIELRPQGTETTSV